MHTRKVTNTDSEKQKRGDELDERVLPREFRVTGATAPLKKYK
jgi:hypothetical protein